jgi:hypothetical protein
LEEAVHLGFISSGDVKIAEALKAMRSVRTPKDITRLTTETLTQALKNSSGVNGKKATEAAAKVLAAAKLPTAAFSRRSRT